MRWSLGWLEKYTRCIILCVIVYGAQPLKYPSHTLMSMKNGKYKERKTRRIKYIQIQLFPFLVLCVPCSFSRLSFLNNYNFKSHE